MPTKKPAPEAAVEVPLTATLTVNSNLDAPTIFVDAIQGAMVAPTITKLFFLEQLTPFGETKPKGRYVLNMAFPTDQLRPLAQALISLADEMGL